MSGDEVRAHEGVQAGWVTVRDGAIEVAAAAPDALASLLQAKGVSSGQEITAIPLSGAMADLLAKLAQEIEAKREAEAAKAREDALHGAVAQLVEMAARIDERTERLEAAVAELHGLVAGNFKAVARDQHGHTLIQIVGDIRDELRKHAREH